MERAMSIPIWDRAGKTRHRAQLILPVEADVAVVGAGITGLTAALRLAREERRVVVLERHGLGEGGTGMTSAHVTALLDRPYADLIEALGVGVAGNVLRASQDAIASIEALAQEMPHDVGFARVPGYIWASDKEQQAWLHDEVRALGELGVTATLQTTSPLPFPVLDVMGVDDQARLHPRLYMAGLTELCLAAGVQIYEDTPVVSFEEGEPCVLHTAQGVEVRAGRVIFAAHAPLTRVALQARCLPYTSYVVAFRAEGDIPDMLATDLSDPYYYVRSLREGGDWWWVVGGMDHRTGQERHTGERFDALMHWCQERFDVRPEDVPYRWTSKVLETPDGLPFVGTVPGKDRLYLATGFGGTGLTWGTLSGEILTELCLDRAHPYAELFSPSRLDVLAEGPRVMREAASTGACYIGDRLQNWDASSFDEVPRGAGCVVRRGLNLYAVHRDERGHLTVLDAICTHLGSVVRFNPAAGTWDCPSHGSRFDVHGDVLEGPALTCLARAEGVAVEEKGDPVLANPLIDL